MYSDLLATSDSCLKMLNLGKHRNGMVAMKKEKEYRFNLLPAGGSVQLLQTITLPIGGHIDMSTCAAAFTFSFYGHLTHVAPNSITK